MVAVVNQLAAWVQWTFNTALPAPDIPPVMPLKGQRRAVAVITPYFIGDSVLMTTFLQNLARFLPSGMPIYCIGHKVHLNVLETLPEVTACYADPSTQAAKGTLLKQLDCDTVFLLRYSLPWAFAMRNAQVLNRVGFDLGRLGVNTLPTWGSLLTHPIHSGQYDTLEHQLSVYQSILGRLGGPWDPALTPQVNLRPDDIEMAHTVWQNRPHPRIILHASAGSPGKRWPRQYWIDLLNKMAIHYPTASIISVGTRKDSVFYETLDNEVRYAIQNLCGQTTLRQTAALCQTADLVLTLDTAVAHLAALVGAPSLVIIYGPTNISQWRPIAHPNTAMEQVYLNVACRPCLTRICYHQSCLHRLTPAYVFSYIQKAVINNFVFK